MKIHIIGGGPAGLYFALLMKKLDPHHEVHIFERDPAHNTYGWGIVFSQRTMASLRGADFETYQAITEAARSWEDVDVVLQGERISIGGNDFLGIMRIRFLNILQERCRQLGVELHFEHNIPDLDAIRDCDLLVGADGLKSMVREGMREEFQTRTETRRNYYIWYGTPQIFDALTMMFRSHPDGLYIAHAYKFDPNLSTFIVECDPETWERAGFAAMTEQQTAAYLADIFQDELDGQPLKSNASSWYNFVLVRNNRWHHENIVLLGDALHSVHFSIGSGTKLAVEDAIALSGSFAEKHSIQAALKDFERRRKPRTEAFQFAALDSLLWLENIREHVDQDALPFAYQLMTRSNRVGHRRLKDQDPEFLERYERWHWDNVGPIYEDFLDLFEKKAYAHLGSLLHDGRPHVTPVWVDYDGECLLINSAKGRQKDLNMERRRHVSVEISDPEDPNRYIMVFGEVVEITEEGAEEHVDKLAQRYLGVDRYPPSWRFAGEVRRIYKIKPDRVIHWHPFGGW